MTFDEWENVFFFSFSSYYSQSPPSSFLELKIFCISLFFFTGMKILCILMDIWNFPLLFFRPSIKKKRNTHTHTLFSVIHLTNSLFLFPVNTSVELHKFVCISFYSSSCFLSFIFFVFDPSCPYTYICSSSLPVAVCVAF